MVCFARKQTQDTNPYTWLEQHLALQSTRVDISFYLAVGTSTRELAN